MNDLLGVGLFLPNDPSHLGLISELIDNEADYFELSPESFWTGSSTGGGIELHESVNLFLKIRDFLGKPFVGHGLAYSIGTPLQGSTEINRTEDWLEALAESNKLFDFQWYSEHLGFSNSASGIHTVLPLPLPHNEESVATITKRLHMVAGIIPAVAFENSVFYFSIDDPGEEAVFYNNICRVSGAQLMLDLHNVYTHCLNFSLDPYEFLGKIDLKNVIQVHLSGGSFSEPQWLQSSRIVRLDSHDDLIPLEVMELFEYMLPLAPSLRGVIVERLHATLKKNDVDDFKRQFRKVKSLFYDLGTYTVE